MSKIHAAITAVNGYVPDYILTNKELETMVDTNDEWIVTRTGISERRILKEPGKATSDLAVPAVKGLLEKRGISAEEIQAMGGKVPASSTKFANANTSLNANKLVTDDEIGNGDSIFDF